MNNFRRKKLMGALDKLSELPRVKDKDQAVELLGCCQSIVEECQDDEQMALDSMPESLQFSSRYEDMEENIDNLSDANDSLTEAMEELTDADAYDYSDCQESVSEAIDKINEAISR